MFSYFLFLLFLGLRLLASEDNRNKFGFQGSQNIDWNPEEWSGFLGDQNSGHQDVGQVPWEDDVGHGAEEAALGCQARLQRLEARGEAFQLSPDEPGDGLHEGRAVGLEQSHHHLVTKFLPIVN